MATMLSQKLVEAQEANDTVRDFMRRFEVGKLLSSCPAKKCDGHSLAGRIRKQARQKAPDVLLGILKDAIKAGHKAKCKCFPVHISRIELSLAARYNPRFQKKSDIILY